MIRTPETHPYGMIAFCFHMQTLWSYFCRCSFAKIVFFCFALFCCHTSAERALVPSVANPNCEAEKSILFHNERMVHICRCMSWYWQSYNDSLHCHGCCCCCCDSVVKSSKKKSLHFYFFCGSLWLRSFNVCPMKSFFFLTDKKKKKSFYGWFEKWNLKGLDGYEKQMVTDMGHPCTWIMDTQSTSLPQNGYIKRAKQNEDENVNVERYTNRIMFIYFHIILRCIKCKEPWSYKSAICKLIRTWFHSQYFKCNFGIISLSLLKHFNVFTMKSVLQLWNACLHTEENKEKKNQREKNVKWTYNIVIGPFFFSFALFCKHLWPF